ncbi:DUF3231 family protein [Paenibacillus antri]|uniref:DUF3231 family protein n=1 Tax=Paenibacillus antri TaxID=2582848 RepID=UPI001EE48F73|nr:DUF3231 family protein [Paenibacillus antri]
MKTREPLTSAEMGKLWATYMGNSMELCVLRYYLKHVDDEDIKNILQKSYDLSEEFSNRCAEILKADNHPVPFGFSDQDVNVEAPRLFGDEFYLHYLKYVAKAGLSIYGIAVPLVTRPDMREFFTHVLNSTVNLMTEINGLLEAKSFLVRPPQIPVPTRPDYARKQSYLSGFIGPIRPLHALEIAHLHDNLENNATSRTVLVGFSQVAQTQEARDYFLRGGEIAGKHYKIFSEILSKEHLPSPPILNHLVTESTISPFSDKLMIFHKLDMFSMRIRSYANSMAVSPRHDLAATYGRLMLEVGKYAEDGARIMIDAGGLEQPPQAADREALVSH